ncbi:MAG: hypothetical protein ACOX8O_00115 [Christensenellales bacterium]
MDIKENQYMGPWMNAPGTTLPWYSASDAAQSPYYNHGMSPMLSGAQAYPCVYPDIYYIMQPHIMRACDEIEIFGSMPGEEWIEQKCDQIQDDVCIMHPELAEYAREYQAAANNPSANPAPNPDGFGFPGRFRPRPGFRPQRGVFGDLIRILLLSELFSRRRRRYF